METLGRCLAFIYVCMRVGMHACLCVPFCLHLCFRLGLGLNLSWNILGPPSPSPPTALVVLSVWGWVLGCGGALDLRSLGPGSVCFVIAVGACGLVVVRSSFWFLKKIRCLANISMQVRVCSGSTSVKMWPGPAGELWLFTPADECHFRSGSSSSLWH